MFKAQYKSQVIIIIIIIIIIITVAVIKTGSSGLIAYRLLTKDLRWIWLQTSLRVIYKNSKPEFTLCTHRHLT